MKKIASIHKKTTLATSTGLRANFA